MLSISSQLSVSAQFWKSCWPSSAQCALRLVTLKVSQSLNRSDAECQKEILLAIVWLASLHLPLLIPWRKMILDILT